MSCREENRRASRLVAGGLLVLVGILFVLQNLGVVRAGHLGAYWPLFLVWIGLTKLAGSKGARQSVWGAVILALGVLFELDELDILWVPLRDVWPAFLITLGIGLVAESVLAKRADRTLSPPSQADRGGRT